MNLLAKLLLLLMLIAFWRRETKNWFGRILRDGTFEPSRKNDAPAELLPALRDFAAKPAQVAAAHGRLTGRCCFCNSGLDDPRSTAEGYGPTCAKHFGLPWGGKRAAAPVTAATVTAEAQGFKLEGFINTAPAPATADRWIEA